MLSGPLRLLSEAVAALRAQDPTELPGAQALAETVSLLAELQVLHVVGLRRLADVESRGLYGWTTRRRPRRGCRPSRSEWTGPTSRWPPGWTRCR